MRVIAKKGVVLLSQFDNINENDIPILERLANLPPQFRDKPDQKKLINNHSDANEGKIKGYLYLKDNFGFFKAFKRVTKKLSFHLVFKTNDLEKNI